MFSSNPVAASSGAFLQIAVHGRRGSGASADVLVFFGNPEAELPEYSSHLMTKGEGYRLDIENDFYKVSLSRQMGQIERMTIKREHGLELFSGGEGHGEPPGIDWAHDYVASGAALGPGMEFQPVDERGAAEVGIVSPVLMERNLTIQS